jgi:hypothetical protein
MRTPRPDARQTRGPQPRVLPPGWLTVAATLAPLLLVGWTRSWT